MLFNLDVLGTNRNLLNLNVVNDNYAVSILNDGIGGTNGDTIALSNPLLPGSTYNIVFPAESNSYPFSGSWAGSGSTVITSLDDIGLNIPVSNSILSNGGIVQITPTVPITTLDIAAPTTTPTPSQIEILQIQNPSPIGGGGDGFTRVISGFPHGLSGGEVIDVFVPGAEDPVATITVSAILGDFDFEYVETVVYQDNITSGFPFIPGAYFNGNIVYSIYSETINIVDADGGCGDLEITLDWGAGSAVFNDTNQVSQNIPDESTVDITVTCSNLYTYQNTVRVYTNDVDASVLMQPVITDNTDPDFRRVYPNFFTIIEPCSYNVHLYDGQAANWGEIFYDENDTIFSEMNRNTVFNPCGPATVDFTQTIHVHEIGGSCGSGSPLMFDPPASWTHPVVTVTEYFPEFTPNVALSCCQILDEVIDFYPASTELQQGSIHDACDIDTSATTVLEYTLTAPDGTTINQTYTGIELAAGPYSATNLSFTPDQFGAYTLVVDITNCCDTRSYTYTFDACYSYTVTNTSCNIINIENLSSRGSISYTIRKLTDYDTFEPVTIDGEEQTGIDLASGDIDINLNDDGLYTIIVTDNHPSTSDTEFLFLLDCNIKSCKKDFLLKVLCQDLPDCDKEARIELLAEWAEFKALEEIVYQKWDEYKLQQSIVDTFSINDIMEDVTTMSKALSSMSKICNECVTLEDEDCGCS